MSATTANASLSVRSKTETACLMFIAGVSGLSPQWAMSCAVRLASSSGRSAEA